MKLVMSWNELCVAPPCEVTSKSTAVSRNIITFCPQKNQKQRVIYILIKAEIFVYLAELSIHQTPSVLLIQFTIPKRTKGLFTAIKSKF